MTPVRAIIWDGHSSWDDDQPGVDGSPLEGVYVGCQKQPGKAHGAIVFPPLLEALASLEPEADLDTQVAGWPGS